MVGAGGLTVGLTGTIGFSVSVLGTGGHTLFSNFTVAAFCLSQDSSLVGDVIPPSQVLSKSVGG